MPRGIYTRKKNGDGLTANERRNLKKMGETKKKRKNGKRRVTTRFVEGFMSGYLLGMFDARHDIKRGVTQIERQARLTSNT